MEIVPEGNCGPLGVLFAGAESAAGLPRAQSSQSLEVVPTARLAVARIAAGDDGKAAQRVIGIQRRVAGPGGCPDATLSAAFVSTCADRLSCGLVPGLACWPARR